jgi:hypothetical protein
MSYENLRHMRTPNFRMSFPILPPMEPRRDEQSGRQTYGLMMLFPPPFDRKPFEVALKAAMIVKHGDEPKKWPRMKRNVDDVIQDFEKYNANAKTVLSGNWKGWWFINANARAGGDNPPPAVVGPLLGPDGKFPVITDRREIYGGRWARASIDAYYFVAPGGLNNGLTFGLSIVQLLKPDTRFGYTRPTAEQDFDEVHGEMAGEGDAFSKGPEVNGGNVDSKW